MLYRDYITTYGSLTNLLMSLEDELSTYQLPVYSDVEVVLYHYPTLTQKVELERLVIQENCQAV